MYKECLINISDAMCDYLIKTMYISYEQKYAHSVYDNMNYLDNLCKYDLT